METNHLKKFLNNLGDSIHSLNTICVGLSYVGEGLAKKPEKLSITWNTIDPLLSAKKSRRFAVRSTFIFLAESIYHYLESVKSVIFSEELLTKYSGLQENVRRVNFFNEHAYSEENDYRKILMLLIVHWRNRIVHVESQATLTKDEFKILIESKNLISENHSDLDIEKTIENFEANSPSLKDISSLVANAIYIIRLIDKNVIKSLTSVEKVKLFVISMGLDSEHKELLKLEDGETKERKINYFYKLHFQEFDDYFSDQIKISLREKKFYDSGNGA
ncbi:hypothetical protein EHR01_06445 [Leptospira mtsangambouensis]|uniref:RiboL-PSP-HEPN domain-containing protein n=1 Tax=Leptospira mtsangambouensis TaxID=2484912 RepID=A0ABY2P4J3_9LEPT|nr:hypothetical protein [Leptospira mtsangambouensis]TGM82415.1 hypothetical protein EHR01_06445 [Leptospira mtsangambouensis]